MKYVVYKYLSFSIFFISICFTKAYSFNGRSVDYLSIDQGLSNNNVLSVFQDHRGFMWFGTFDGLNRYDGYGVTVFRNRINDSNSLVHNWVYGICEDQSNNIWVGTKGGVSIYNTVSGKFNSVWYRPIGNGILKKITIGVNGVSADINGNVFVGTLGDGLLFCPHGEKVPVQIPLKKGGDAIKNYDIMAIKVAADKRVWLLVRNVGLCLYDYHSKSVVVINESIKSPLCIEDDGAELWIGTPSGVIKYNTISNSFILDEEVNKDLVYVRVKSIIVDKARNLWIGTDGGGIKIYNLNTHLSDYINSGNYKNALSSSSVNVLFRDKESRTWIGTVRGGINIINAREKPFLTVSNDPFNPNSLIYNFISSFNEDRYGNLWIGTDGGGLSIWNRQKNIFTNYRHTNGTQNGLSGNFITNIQIDSKNNVWIATINGGIVFYNPSTKNFKQYRCFNADGTENKAVYTLLIDKSGDIWASTFQPGILYLYNRKTDRFDIFNTDFHDLFTLYEDHSGVLWAGGNGKLIQIDKNNKKHRIFEVEKIVRAILEDAKGNLWIGIEDGGLALFDRQKMQIVNRFTTENGLCSNSVLNILEDKSGNLWISTFNGIARFNPLTQHFINYYQNDGLQSNQFNYKAALALKSGELVFGGIKGFNIFDPARIIESVSSPQIVLSGISINTIPLEKDSSCVIIEGKDAIKEIRVPYNKALLSFDFTAPEYSSPNKILYAYFMEGWDRQWNFSGNKRYATYTHLNEGTYIFRAKCSNVAGAWMDNEVMLKIIVLPPWYRSWWAYSIYLLTLGTVVVSFLLYRAKQIRLQYEVTIANLNLEKAKAEGEKDKAELAREKAEHEKERVISEREKEITEKKMSFFTNVSHEFRTPLTLIINPIKELIEKNVKKEDNTNDNTLHIVYRNARRLLSLVNQLLLFRKTDSYADQLKIAKLNFSYLCKEVYLCFVQQAKSKNIQYSFICENDNIEVYGDKEKIEIIFYNILSNAIKYTREGGTVLFSIIEKENTIEIQVKDTGVGIPKETGDKLFEKFYQVKGTTVHTGFGIGLYLAKQFTDAHKGSISYESEIGVGTTFIVNLLKGNSHFEQEVFAEDAVDRRTLLDEITDDNLLADFADNKTETLKTVSGDKLIDLMVTEKKSILIVEDDKEIRNYVASLFSKEFSVYEAQNGTEGMKLAGKYYPDIIISDITMEGMNGIDFCKTIKENPATSHIPVILLTANTSSETKLQGIEGGADDYITKPFEKDLLIARVSTLLKNRNSLQRYFYNEITFNKNDLKVAAEYKEFLEKCIEIVESHLEDDNFNSKTFMSAMGMSRSNLLRKVKSVSGLSINEFIRFIRLRKAAELFINTKYNINEIAFQVGISDIKYFREQFNKVFGMNPSDYIRRYRKALGYKHTVNKDITAANNENKETD